MKAIAADIQTDTLKDLIVLIDQVNAKLFALTAASS